MRSLHRKTWKTGFILGWAILLMNLSGCGIIQETFPRPETREFPTLTPLPSQTATPSAVPSASSTTLPTAITPVQEGTPLPVSGQDIHPENVAQLELIAEFGKGIPQQISAALDGSLLGVASTNGVYLYDPQTLQEILSFETGNWQHCLAFSDDSAQIASADRHGFVQVWDTNAGEQITVLHANDQPVLVLAFSPDGQSLAAASWDGIIRLWNLADGELLRTFSARQLPVRALAFSADKNLLFAWAPRESIQVWSLEDGRAREDIYIGKDERGYLSQGGSFTQDGALFAANHGLRIRIFLTRNGTTLRLIRDLQDPVQTMALSQNGAFLAAAGQEFIKVWELENGSLSATFTLPPSHNAPLIALSPDGSTLYTLTNSLMRWRIPLNGNANITEPDTVSRSEFSSSICPYSQLIDQENLLLGCLDGSVDVYQVKTGEMTSLLPGTGEIFNSLTLSPDRSLAAYGTYSGEIILQPIDPAETLLSLESQSGPVRCLAFSADGQLFASGAEDGLVQVWQISDQTLIASLEQNAVPQAVTFLPDNKTLLVRTRDGIQVWSLDEQTPRHSLPGYTMALSGDGELLAAAVVSENTRVIHLYRLPSAELDNTIAAAGSQLALSPDHSLLAQGGENITLWDTRSGLLLQTLPGDKLFGNLKFSPDGNWLILTAWDGAVRLWAVPE